MFVEMGYIGDLYIALDGNSLIDTVGDSSDNFGSSRLPLILKDGASLTSIQDVDSEDAPWEGEAFNPDCGETCFEDNIYGK